jgi:magnesium-transporting ATPase (P-type)
VNSATSLASPILYQAGPQHLYFNFKVFWKWMLLALYHGWVCYFFPILGYKGVENSSGMSSQHWYVSTISFTLCLHIVTYKLFMESYFWTNIQM